MPRDKRKYIKFEDFFKSGKKGYLLDTSFMVDMSSLNCGIAEILTLLKDKVRKNYSQCFYEHKRMIAVYIGKTSVTKKSMDFKASDPKTWGLENISLTWDHGSIAKEGMIVISTAITDAVVPSLDESFNQWKKEHCDRSNAECYALFLENELINLCQSDEQFTVANDEYFTYHAGNKATHDKSGFVLYMKFKNVRLQCTSFLTSRLPYSRKLLSPVTFAVFTIF